MQEQKRQATYKMMRDALNERQWRLYVALEAQTRGRGGIAAVARESGTSRTTIRKGLAEIARGELHVAGARLRRTGGGRKRLSTHDPTLATDLEALVDTVGDPMSLLKWSTKSISNIQHGLEAQGHTVGETTVRRMLVKQDYSLQANKKTDEGSGHADRDAQFGHITAACAAAAAQGGPMVSVDCKKKELLGNFKNSGREWHPTGQPVHVNVYDFLSLADGKAIPYGVYDVLRNAGFVNVGQDHDTAAFSVESIRRWWQHQGKRCYPDAQEILIVADGGGSNSTRGRLWKRELQHLANETGLALRITHLPPGTSKWNKIEHRLFSYISINWRARPLVCMELVLELISATTTAAGLTVEAVVDTNTYPTKIRVSKQEFDALNLVRDPFHGDWNYTLHPQAIDHAI